ncbi:D-alanyl-D-alanine carboxypeptidase [bacterium]|nr:D-alanyl-D-alanine carboxypeptidase [bacterium]
MKKVVAFILILVLLIPGVTFAEDDPTPNAGSSILMEVSTKTILYEKNKDSQVAVASLTKMMAQILILEAIESGNLTWDEQVKASSNAAGYGGTQIYLQPGEMMSVRDLMKGITMASANDATVVLAERIAGSEEAFVKMMNEKAQKLGLKNTNFMNPTGLDEDNHYSSAYDMALIAIELLKHDEILEFSSVYEDYLRTDTPNKFWLVNTNKLVRFYDGADGLKTGFTDNAGYTMAVTAKRNDMRLIAIVLGEAVSKVRNQETTSLLDYGFNLYKVQVIKKQGDVIKTVDLNKATKNKVDVVLDRDITVLSKKSDTEKSYTEKVNINEVKLPLKENQVVGNIEIYDQGKQIGSYPLIVKEDVKKKNIFKLFLDNLKDIVVGNLVF